LEIFIFSARIFLNRDFLKILKIWEKAYFFFNIVFPIFRQFAFVQIKGQKVSQNRKREVYSRVLFFIIFFSFFLQKVWKIGTAEPGRVTIHRKFELFYFLNISKILLLKKKNGLEN